MRKLLATSLVALVAALGFTTAASAATIGFDLDETPASVGETVFVDVVLSDIFVPSVLTLNVRISYDTSVVSFVSASLAGQLDPFPPGWAGDAFLEPATDIIVISASDTDFFFFPDDIGNGVIATIGFLYDPDANGPLVTSLDISVISNIILQTDSGSIVPAGPGTPGGPAVPEPAGALTFAAGTLVVSAALRRRRS